MKKIFWGLQNLNLIGGTETVSVQLMNMLAPYYEIHLIVLSKIEGEINYHLDPRIKIIELNVPTRVGRFDQFYAQYKKERNWKEMLGLFKDTLDAFVFHRGKTRKMIASLMDDDSIYIGDALDSYLNAPKKGHVYFHFHFNEKEFFAPANRLGFFFSRKPEKFIFLTDSTREKVCKKKPRLKNKSVSIYNPTRFPSTLDLSYHGNSILFVGRFSEQKDPLFALEIAKSLHERSFPFKMKMYGEGHLEGAMRDFIKAHSLNEVEIIVGHPIKQEDFLNSDLILCTSRFEGFYLVKGEANACSRPVITTRWEGPIDEIFSAETDGWIINEKDPSLFAEKIIQVLTDEKLLMDAKKKAYEGSKRFSEEMILSKWREIFK